MAYDYTLRVQVNGFQEHILRYIKSLRISGARQLANPERDKVLLALGAYYAIETLQQAELENLEKLEVDIQQVGEQAILELSYQIQLIAKTAGIDLNEIEIPEPVRSLVEETHGGVRAQFLQTLNTRTQSNHQEVEQKRPARRKSKNKPAEKNEELEVSGEVRNGMGKPNYEQSVEW